MPLAKYVQEIIRRLRDARHLLPVRHDGVGAENVMAVCVSSGNDGTSLHDAPRFVKFEFRFLLIFVAE